MVDENDISWIEKQEEDYKKIDIYQSLNDKEKEKTDDCFNAIKSDVLDHFDEIKIKDKYTNDQLLNEITLPEEIVDRDPLHVFYHKLVIGKPNIIERHREIKNTLKGRIRSLIRNFDDADASLASNISIYGTHHGDVYERIEIGQELILEGNDTEIYFTNKRIMLLNTDAKQYPSLEKSVNIDLGYSASDSCKVLSIPHKDISSISINLHNKVSKSQRIEKKTLSGLAVIGILIAFFGLLLGVASGAYEWRILSLVFGFVLAIIGYAFISYNVLEPKGYLYKGSYIMISLVEPFYRERALLIFEINTKKHDLTDIVNWVKKLQLNCKHIVLQDNEQVIKIDKR